MTNSSINMPNLVQSDRVVPLPEGAVLMGVSASTAKRLGARGEIKILKLSTRRIGIRLSEINRWLDSRAA